MEARIDAPPKPAAVKVLQAFGVLWLLFGAVPLAGGAIAGDDLGAIHLFGVFLVFAGLLALLAGWRRPVGLVSGIVSLSLILVTLIGALFVAIVGFLGAKDRELVREYYASGIRR